MSDIQLTGFEVLEKLGEGGMAAVWKARQISLDRIVAIKVLSSSFASDPEDIEMFQKEAQQAAKLKHPGIVQVYDANAENGHYFFVMEYVAGYTVGDWLRRKERLSEKDTLLVAECVADALEYAWNHSRIIHCDIKPDNVMLDDDGSVKVTDLGLARTISVMQEDNESENVMGTPAYMSPEQALGRSDMDFRSDIYSLGAMLYHLSTGKMMFEEYPDAQIMELQVGNLVQDPLDLNPDLSKPFCWLIEKMLAKEPEDRPVSWEEVRKDINRVKKRMVPIGCLKEGQVSSVQRSVKRTRRDLKKVTASSRDSRSPLQKILAVVAVLIVVGLAIAFSGKASRKQPAQTHVESIENQNVATQNTVNQKELQAKGMYDFAAKWVKANPIRFSEGIDRFSQVTSQTRGTKYSLMASDQVKKLRLLWNNELKKVLRRLKDETSYYAENGELLYAANMYEKYKGPYQKDTEVQRLKMAAELRARKKRQDEQAESNVRRLKQKYEGTLNKVASMLIKQDIEPAIELARNAMYDKDMIEHEEYLSSLVACLKSASKMDEKILASFLAQRGKVVAVEFASGKRTVSIVGVKDGLVTARQQQGSSRAVLTVSFGLDKLSIKERLLRMGDDSQSDVALVKGLMAVKSGSDTYAKTFFKKTHPLVADRLIVLLSGAVSQKADGDAKGALIKGLANLGIKVQLTFDEWEWSTAIDEVEFSIFTVKNAAAFVSAYKTKYGNSQFCKQAENVINALSEKKASSAAVGAVAPATAPKAESRLTPPPSRLSHIDRAIVKGHEPANENEVIERFLNDNPDVMPDAVEILSDSEGHVYRINIYSPNIRNISAVSICKSLREFYCGAVAPGHWLGEERAPLSNLSPLKGLPLEKLYLAGTSVKDIGVLSGMKLVSLDLRCTKVVNLTPLKYMDLAYINLEEIQLLKDISILSHMNLEVVNLNGTKVYNFKPLMRKKITKLGLADTQFKDLSILSGMPLEALDLRNSKVYDFKTISRYPIKKLNLSGTQIKDLSVLRGMPLQTLSLLEVRARGFDVLAGLPLQNLYADGSSLDDIGLVVGPKLITLHVGYTQVKDIAAIAKMPALRSFSISGLRIRDLSPLAGLKLDYLYCNGFRSDDLRPLAAMRRLEGISVDNPEKDGMLPVLARIRGLKSINGYSLAYWRGM